MSAFALPMEDCVAAEDRVAPPPSAAGKRAIGARGLQLCKCFCPSSTLSITSILSIFLSEQHPGETGKSARPRL